MISSCSERVSKCHEGMDKLGPDKTETRPDGPNKQPLNRAIDYLTGASAQRETKDTLHARTCQQQQKNAPRRAINILCEPEAVCEGQESTGQQVCSHSTRSTRDRSGYTRRLTLLAACYPTGRGLPDNAGTSARSDCSTTRCRKYHVPSRTSSQRQHRQHRNVNSHSRPHQRSGASQGPVHYGRPLFWFQYGLTAWDSSSRYKQGCSRIKTKTPKNKTL